MEGPDPLVIWPTSSGANPHPRNSEIDLKVGGVAADCSVVRAMRLVLMQRLRGAGITLWRAHTRRVASGMAAPQPAALRS